MYKKKKKEVNKGGGSSAKETEMEPQFSFKEIMKDIQFLGTSHMSWKEKKEMENRKVVSLGGKAPKKQRLPLSVARLMMKNQKKREQKMLQENMILSQFGGKSSSTSNAKKVVEGRKPEDRVLKASEGRFSNGVLDVKHLLRPVPVPSRESGKDRMMSFNGKGKKKSGRKQGKKKGGGKKRR